MSDYYVIFDGTSNRPLGRLLFPPTLPPPVSPRYVTVAPEPVVAPPPTLSAEEVSRAISRRNSRNRSGGEVHAAKDRIWAMLATPHTVLEVIDALGLPANGTYCAMGIAYRAGVVERGPDRMYPHARKYQKVSRTYQQAAAYRHRESWPHVVQTREERAKAHRQRKARAVRQC